jgi:TonB-dependent receptor
VVSSTSVNDMLKLPFRRKLLAVLILQAGATPGFAADDNAANADSASTTAMDVVTIQAQRTSLAQARAAQKDAGNLVNLMTVEEMRKLPDVNIAESVRRIPGISLETDTGEGRYVNIRGLDADLNSTTFGGLRLPPSNNASPFGGGRAVALDAIPTGLVGAITVTKTLLPEQDAEALGGTIEITPKTVPRGSTLFGEARIGSGLEALRHTGIIDFSFSGGGRFGTGGGATHGLQTYGDRPFSLVITGAYYEDKRAIDDVEPSFLDDGVHSPYAYSAIEQRRYQYNRKRHGVGIDLGYQSDADNSYYVRAFDAGYTETVLRNRLVVNLDGAPVAQGGQLVDGVAAGGFDKTLRDEKERINNKVFILGGRHDAGDRTLDYRVGYTHGSFVKLYDYNADFNATPGADATIRYDHSGRGNTPAFALQGADYLDPAGYRLASFGNSTTDIQDKEYSAAANLKLPVAWGRFDAESIKTGLNARWRTREAAGQPYSYVDLPAIGLASAAGGGNVGFYHGQYQNGVQMTPGLLQNELANHVTVSESNRLNAAMQHQRDQEDVLAAYGQYEMKSGRLGIVGGLRVERTHADYAGNAKRTDAGGSTSIAPVDYAHSYTNFFPSAQARYELDASTLVRAAYSSAIARPGFNQVSPALNIDIGAGRVSQGNPNLKPTVANNLDLSLERYLPHAGIVSATLFYKDIKDYIGSRMTTQTFPNSGLYAGLVGPVRFNSWANLEKSHAAGLELNYEQRFKELPGIWSGLGAGVNYTLVASRFQIRPGESSPLPSTSRQTANASVFYERRGLNVRLGAYYLTRNLWAIGGDRATDVYSEPRLSLDFGSSYALNDGASLYFNAKNLSNTALTFTEGRSDRTIQREYYGATYQLGVNLTF